ncbi:MAG TPA: hypothetical protein ENN41_03695 [Sediminispirochaeta sp.]|nr:hypothetical protein [Sediminispirochaeta sp.]
MKVKAFIFLFLVLIIAGAVFYFGWVQFQLSEHGYAVVFSKTGGYEEETLKAGEFNWRWEALIPGNFSLHQFKILPQRLETGISGALPSAELYAQALDEEDLFTYNFQIALEYSLVPEELPRLVKERGLLPEKLEDFYKSLEREIVNSANEFLERKIIGLTSYEGIGSFRRQLLRHLQEEFQAVELEEPAILEFKIPDFELYLTAKRLYLDLVETRRKTEVATLEKEREWMVSEESKLEVLEAYGKLFTEYPGLVQYLSLGREQGSAELLPNIQLLPRDSEEGAVE